MRSTRELGRFGDAGDPEQRPFAGRFAEGASAIVAANRQRDEQCCGRRAAGFEHFADRYSAESVAQLSREVQQPIPDTWTRDRFPCRPANTHQSFCTTTTPRQRRDSAAVLALQRYSDVISGVEGRIEIDRHRVAESDIAWGPLGASGLFRSTLSCQRRESGLFVGHCMWVLFCLLVAVPREGV